MKKRRTFITFSIGIIGGALLFALMLSLLLRYIGMYSAESRAQKAAEVVQETLNAHMVAGVSERQNDFLEQAATLEGMHRLWVVRSESVSKQYGDGIYSQLPRDDIDREVLREGKPVSEVSGGLFSDTIYRVSIPYIATDKGKIDCLSCHDAKNSQTLGVISIEMSVNDLKAIGFIGWTVILALLGAGTVLLVRNVRRFIASYRETLDAIAKAMEEAERGEYANRIVAEETQDGYRAAMWTNALLEKLDNTLNESSKKLSSLIRLDRTNTDPLYQLKAGIEQLDDVERFRTAIEKDRNLEEVYGRIIALLRTRWGLSDFNILEVNPMSRATRVVHSEKTLLCDAASGCRADREAGTIDSSACELACPKMIDPSAHYLCRNYPIIDDLDIVISLVTYDASQLAKMKIALDQLSNFIDASRLQIVNKKLQQIVRIDPLTQLYNRAYLEELSKLIVAQSRRTAIPYGILMIDMDGFDAINQAYDASVGDEVIKAIARNILENLKPGDVVVRYEGDVFAVVLYDWEANEVMEVAEAIRASFKKKIRVNTYAILKTISIGIALFPSQTDSVIDAVEYAKRALLEAKHRGGNCSMLYDASSMPM